MLTTAIHGGASPPPSAWTQLWRHDWRDSLGSPAEARIFYLRELIEQGLDDLEDAYLGAASLDSHRRSGEASIPRTALMEDLGLED